MKYFVDISIFLISLQLQAADIRCQNAFNFVIQKFYWEGGISAQKMQFFVAPVNYNPGLQLVDLNYSSPIPIGNNVLVKLNIDADTQLLRKETWIPLYAIDEDLCKLLDLFLGQMIYDMETALGIIPKSCPLPRGAFHAVNHTIDFRTLKLQTFPYGNIRFRASGIEKQSKENLFKLGVIFQNHKP